MQVITRTKCVVCDARLTRPMVVQAHVPIYMGTTQQPIEDDIFADQKWTTCLSCGCVQLTELLDPTLLYASGHTPGTVGTTWTKHHNEFADAVVRKSPKRILEVGAGTTLLASLIQQRANIESYTIVDPNVVDLDDNVQIIRQLVTPAFSLDAKFDTVIHSHTMEHFYNPVEELSALTRLLSPGGQMIVSVPLIVNSILDGFSNGLNFEHTYMTAVTNLYVFFARAGLHVTSMSSFNQYNVFITAVKDSSRAIKYPDDAKSNGKILLQYHEKLALDINSIRKQLVGRDPITTYIFGAHIFAQSLLSKGALPIIAILDNDVNKHGHRLYGTPFHVASPYVIESDHAPTVILRAGQYSKEIEDQLRIINPTVTII